MRRNHCPTQGGTGRKISREKREFLIGRSLIGGARVRTTVVADDNKAVLCQTVEDVCTCGEMTLRYQRWIQLWSGGVWGPARSY